MNRSHTTIIMVAACLLGAPSWRNAVADEKPSKPKDRVIAMYFHRTQRCPTCLKMGSYTEEAMKAAFEKQLKEGTVEFHYVDFQNQKNAVLTKGYKITGPALIVTSVKRQQGEGIPKSQGDLDKGAGEARVSQVRTVQCTVVPEVALPPRTRVCRTGRHGMTQCPNDCDELTASGHWWCVSRRCRAAQNWSWPARVTAKQRFHGEESVRW